MFEEFKRFALRGNMVDLAIGVIIGAAFSKIVDSIVNDLFMPVLGAITGGLDFSNYFVPLSSNVTATSLDAAKAQGAVFAWGSFLTVAINFLIIAWILFLVIKAINHAQKSTQREIEIEVVEPEEPADIKLLSEIRDLLAKKH